eukprot:gene10233-7172_t
MLTEGALAEFYRHVYPVDLIVRWLTYAFDDLQVPGESEPPTETAAATRQRALHHLARREFCFTLIGDVFTRYRSYTSASELRSELIRSFPEKIDVGAVYSIRPNLKQSVSQICAVERELVFDIDMSDYDNVRSCCTGKRICGHCWQWMACAALVLKHLLEEDFGFNYILPVFSGRRGVHLWVCDKRARFMSDDERAAVVGYLSVVSPRTLRSDVVTDLANHRLVHPSLSRLFVFTNEYFRAIFTESSADNPNNIEHNPPPPRYQGKPHQRKHFLDRVKFTEGDVLRWPEFRLALGERMSDAEDVLFAMQLLLMYPRLDEHVTTRRDHLLKLPFCVHPGTSSLCCPLRWATIREFDPISHAPKLDEILMERRIEDKWLAPLADLLRDMGADPGER